jgi:hypothetical protein
MIVEVDIIKTYYKATSVFVELPDDVGCIDTALAKLEKEKEILSDALVCCVVTEDMDGVEIEMWSHTTRKTVNG